MARDGACENRIGITQAARAAGVSRQAIYNWIEAGLLRPAESDSGGVDATDLARLCAMREAAADLGVRPATLQRIGQGGRPDSAAPNGTATRRRVVANGAKLAYASPLVVAAIVVRGHDDAPDAISGGGDS
jgi:hypothetical protein